MIIQPFGHRETANLADVGFGVSQALPLVVADVGLPNDSVLLVNQPEVHLHPTGQAQLANYFVDRIKKRQYIVETHSEYIINRIRILAQQGKVDPKQIAIIFFASDRRTKSLVKKYDIQLQKDGSLKGAPKQFFQTYYTDSFSLAMGGEMK
jgi:predicted ATPase